MVWVPEGLLAFASMDHVYAPIPTSCQPPSRNYVYPPTTFGEDTVIRWSGCLCNENADSLVYINAQPPKTTNRTTTSISHAFEVPRSWRHSAETVPGSSSNSGGRVIAYCRGSTIYWFVVGERDRDNPRLVYEHGKCLQLFIVGGAGL